MSTYLTNCCICCKLRVSTFSATLLPSFTFDFDFRFWKFPYNPNRSRQCAPQNVRSLRRMLSLYREVCTWAAVHQQGPPLLQPPRPTDCQYSPHHNHRIRRPLGRAAGCRVVTAARFPRVRTNYRQHSAQHPARVSPNCFQCEGQWAGAGHEWYLQVRPQSHHTFIGPLYSRRGVACAVLCMCQGLRYCQPSQGLFSGPKINTS